MRVNVSLIIFAVICACLNLPLSSASTPRRNVDSLKWGQPSDGVEMSLSSTDSNGTDLQVAFRNVGDHDVTLNLGYVMANGKFQLPAYVNLNFTDAQGQTRVFKFADKKHSAIAGRLDDYVVPLRVGSTYTLALTLNQFWCQETKEFEIRLAPGKNRLTAQFQGSGAGLVNLDMPGIKLMNFWLGKVESNSLTIKR
jgi:hypothetical protein